MSWEVVKISDLNSGSLAFDLVDILKLFESDVVASTWAVEDVWAMGELAEPLNRLGETPREPVAGRELLRLAAGVYQIVDGTFDAYHNWEEETRWLRIMAVDSSYYLVATDDAAVAQLIRTRFQTVEHVELDWVF